MADGKNKQLFTQILGKHIRYKRQAQQLTLAQLAEDINMDDKHLSRIENGEKCPNAYTLALIELRLGRLSDNYLQEFEAKKHHPEN